MRTKNILSFAAAVIWTAGICLVAFRIGYQAEKPAPSAEQQMMNLQTYIGVEPDGCFGPLTQQAYLETADREWQESENKLMQRYYTVSGGPE